MKYEQFREVARDGDILFLHVNRKDFLSSLTSWFTKSEYTHAAFVFWYGDRLMVAESTTHGGMRIVTASHYSDRELDIVAAPKEWKSISARVLEKSGTAEYGWFSAAYIGLREFMFTHFDIKLPEDKTNRNQACSEFVAEMLGLPDNDISPGMLMKYLRG